LQFGNGIFRLRPVQIRFALEQMKLRRVASDLQQLREGAVGNLSVAGLLRGDTEHVEINQVARLLFPILFEGSERRLVIASKEVTKPKQISGLLRRALLN